MDMSYMLSEVSGAAKNSYSGGSMGNAQSGAPPGTTSSTNQLLHSLGTRDHTPSNNAPPTSAPSSDHAAVTVREKINKEFRSKDPKQHALYNLLSTSKPDSLNSDKNRQPNNQGVAYQKSNPGSEIGKQAEEASTTGNNLRNTLHERDLNGHARMDSSSSSESLSKTAAATAAPMDTNTSVAAKPAAAGDEQLREAVASPAAPSSPTYYHPKKKYLKYQKREQTEQNISHPAATRAPSTASGNNTAAAVYSAAAVTTNAGAAATETVSSVTRPIDIKVSSESSSTSNTCDKALLSPSFRNTPLPSPPKSTESVKQCMEKFIIQMLHMTNDHDQESSKPNTKVSQEILIQEKIKQFLQDDASGSNSSTEPAQRKVSGYVSGAGGRTNVTSSVASHAPAGSRPGSARMRGHEMTIAQQIDNDIRHVLTEPSPPPSQAPHLSPHLPAGPISHGHTHTPPRSSPLTRAPGGTGGARMPTPVTGSGAHWGAPGARMAPDTNKQRMAEHAQSWGPGSHQGHREAQGHRERSGTMESTGQPERPGVYSSRSGPGSGSYWTAPSDGRSSVDSQSSQPDIRRGSFGKGSAYYDKYREAAIHERNCSSTDVSRVSDARDMDAYRNRARSQTISFPPKHGSSPSSSSRAGPHPHPHPYASPHGGYMRSGYGEYLSHKREGAPGRDVDSMTSSQHGGSERSRDVYGRENAAHLAAGMFYPPAKPASMHSGSISAGLPRIEQSRDILKDAYQMQPSMSYLRDREMSSQNDDPSRSRDPHSKHSRYSDASSHSGRAPPPLVHISGRHQRLEAEMSHAPGEPMVDQRSRSRSPVHARPHGEYWNRHEEGDAPLDLSAPSGGSAGPRGVGGGLSPGVKVPTPLHPHALAAAAAAARGGGVSSTAAPPSASPRDSARDAPASHKPAPPSTAQLPLPYPYAAGKAGMLLPEQAAKMAQQAMTPAQLALYHPDWFKHYRWPGYAMTPDLAAATQIAQLAHLMPGFDPRALAPSAHAPLADTRTSPRPTPESSDREREYYARYQQMLSRAHQSRDPSPAPSPASAPPPQQPPPHHHATAAPPPSRDASVAPSGGSSSLHIPTPSSRNVSSSPIGQHNLQVPPHSSHTRLSPPSSRDKERLANRSIGPNLLGDFPPEDVLFLRCNICRDTYGNVHSFIKHFSRDHASEGDPRRDHVMIESISKAKHAMEHNSMRDQGAGGHYPASVHPAGHPGMSEMEWAAAKEAAMQGYRHPYYHASSSAPATSDVMKCPKCPQEFTTRDWGVFKRHMKSHENSAAAAASITAGSNNANNSSSSSAAISPGPPPPSSARSPYVTSHHDAPSTESSHRRIESQMDIPSSRTQLVCEECRVTFHDNLECQLHMSISHSNRTCMCRICNVSFGHVDAMYKHVYTAHKGLNAVEVEFSCLACIKAFTNERSLIEHIKSKECGIDRNSIGSMISFSVRSRVRDQAAGMSPPLTKKHRMTPDTTCSEIPPNVSASLPVTTIANSAPSPSDTSPLGSKLTNLMDSYMQINKGKANLEQITVIDLIQQKVVQEHKRQSREVISRDNSNSPESRQANYSSEADDKYRMATNRSPSRSASSSVADSQKHDDKYMNPLKRRLLGYDRPTMDSPSVKQVKIDNNAMKDAGTHPSARHMPVLPKINAQSFISNIVETSVYGKPRMDMDKLYKKSIESLMFKEEEEERQKEKEEAAAAAAKSQVVKQEPDSSLKTEVKPEPQPDVKEEKKYTQSLEGVLHTLVEKEAKKLLCSKERDNVESRDGERGGGNSQNDVQTSSQSSMNGSRGSNADCSPDNQSRNDHYAPKQERDAKSVDNKSPSDSQEPKSKGNSYPDSNKKDTVDTSAKSEKGALSRKSSQSAINDTKTTSNDALNEATTPERSRAVLDRMDSYEEGNLVICLEEDEQKANKEQE